MRINAEMTLVTPTITFALCRTKQALSAGQLVAIGHRNCLRAINYPEQRHAPTPGQLRASTHTDYGALTILRLGGAHPGGLQALGLGGEAVLARGKAEEPAGRHVASRTKKVQKGLSWRLSCARRLILGLLRSLRLLS